MKLIKSTKKCWQLLREYCIVQMGFLVAHIIVQTIHWRDTFFHTNGPMHFVWLIIFGDWNLLKRLDLILMYF